MRNIVFLLLVIIILARDDRPRRIDALFQEYNKSDSAGVSISIIQDGKFLQQGFYGQSELRTPVKIHSKTKFLIASVTKQFTAMAVALLQLRGLLNVHDSIYPFLPNLKPLGNVTILDLIQHTSGYRDYFSLAVLAGKGGHFDFTRDEAMAFVDAQQSLMFEPGTNWSYSNTGYLLLEYIIEKVTGKPYSLIMKELIFDPLDMKDSVIATDRSISIPNAAYAYLPGNPQKHKAFITVAMAGTGGLQTTADDFLKWDRNAYDNKLGGGADLIKLLHTPGVFRNGTRHFYGYGIGREYIGPIATYRHSGLWAGQIAYMAKVPDRKLTVFMMSNLQDNNIYVKTVSALKIYLGIEGERVETKLYDTPNEFVFPVPPVAKIAQPSQYVGYYHCPEVPGVLSIKLERDRLFVDLRFYEKFWMTMKPERHYFSFGGFDGRFYEQSGKIIGLLLENFDRAWNLRCSKLEGKPIC